MNAPILASDLRTGRRLRVFQLAQGGSVAVDHALNLSRRIDWFVTGTYETGFTLQFEGHHETFRTWREAVDAFSSLLTELQRKGQAAYGL